MSDFNTVSDWVNQNLVGKDDYSHLVKSKLEELQTMADAEDENLSGTVFRCLVDYRGNDNMRALSSITLNSYNPRHGDYMLNAFAVVLVKPAPHSTDGVFTLVQIVPSRYVLKTTIRCDNKYNIFSVAHTYYNMYLSDRTKPYIVTGTLNGSIEKKIFAHKALHDAKGLMETPDTPGTNDPFTITLPDGSVVQP